MARLPPGGELWPYLIDALPCPIYLRDDQGRFLACNRAFADAAGIPADELIGRSAFEVLDPLTAIRAHRNERGLEPGELALYDAVLRHRDGTLRRYVVQKARIELRDGTSILSGNLVPAVEFDRAGGARNLPEQQQVLFALQETLKELRCLFEVANALGGASDDLAALDDAARRIPSGMQFPEQVAAQIRWEGRTYGAGSLAETPWSLATSFEHGTRHGVVEVRYLSPPPVGAAPFLTSEQRLLEAIALQVQNFVRRSRLAAVLRESERRHREYLESHGDGVVVVDPDLRIVLANPAAKQLLGPGVVDPGGRPLADVLEPGALERLGLETVLPRQTAPSRVDVELVLGGTSRVLQVTSSPLLAADGSWGGTLLGLRDITERVENEQRMARRLEQERTLARIAGRLVRAHVDVSDVVASVHELGRALAADGLCLVPLAPRERFRDLAHRACSGRASCDANGRCLAASEVPKDAWPELRRGRHVLLEVTGDADGRATRFDAFVPLMLDGELHALLVRRGQPDPIDLEHELSLLRVFAGLLGTWLVRRRDDEARCRLAAAVEQAADGIMVVGEDGTVEELNHSFIAASGPRCRTLRGQRLQDVAPRDDAPPLIKHLATLSPDAVPDPRPVEIQCEGRDPRHFEISASTVRNQDGEVNGTLFLVRDVTRRVRLHEQMAQSQRLEAIGSLAAGIAHEINTPTQYVGDNLSFIASNTAGIERAIALLTKLTRAARAGSVPPDLLDEAEHVIDEDDLEFLGEELPQAVEQSNEGITRVTEIVRAMKDFSHPGSAERSPADINEAVRGTVVVSRNEWKYVADVKTDLDPSLPAIACYESQLRQALLNLISNAAHAIRKRQERGDETRGVIRIATRERGGHVEISVEDDGCGVPPAIRDRIFDPFFTTKGVGQGTGQGLSIVRDIVVRSHDGTVELAPSARGARFMIRLPLGP